MNAPSLSLPEHFAIGFNNKPLATASQQIEVESGNHFLLARNGRGKTTLLRTLAGSLKPLAGEANIKGRAQFIGEKLRFDSYLSGRQILTALLPSSNLEAAEDLAVRAELDLSQTYGRYSTGNRQKLHLVLAEFRYKEDEPTILLLDEPFTGLDEPSRQAFLLCWEQRQNNKLRLITIHPDYDGTQLGRAILISEGHIRHAHAEEGQTWGTLKTALA